MSEITAGVIALLVADATVHAQVADRIYPVARPQGSALPSVVVSRIDGGPEYADDGEIGLANGRVQLDVYAETYTACRAASNAVLTAFTAVEADIAAGLTVLHDGVDFRSLHVVFERDARETGGNEAEYLFRRQTDIDVWVQE